MTGRWNDVTQPSPHRSADYLVGWLASLLDTIEECDLPDEVRRRLDVSHEGLAEPERAS